MIANQIPRATWRNTLVYRLNDDLQVGVEYNPLANDLGLLANWRVLREQDDRPAIILGTSSDRIGTPYGRAYYMTVSKQVSDEVGLYVGVSWSEYQQKLLFPAGASYRFDDHWATVLMFDGVNFHQTVSYGWDRYSLTFLLVQMRTDIQQMFGGIHLTTAVLCSFFTVGVWQQQSPIGECTRHRRSE